MPLQVMAPVALDDPAAVVCMLNPTGGLVGGDRAVTASPSMLPSARAPTPA